MPRKKRVDSLYHYKLLPDMCKRHQCGEEFEKVSREWAYKLLVGDRKHQRLRWYCSWRCLREGETK